MNLLKLVIKILLGLIKHNLLIKLYLLKIKIRFQII